MKAILSDDDETIDTAFQHMRRRTGLPADEVVYHLNEALLAGRAQATCYHFVDGELQASGPVRPDFWRDHLTVHLVDGHAEVRALRALVPGVWEYRLPAQAVEALTKTKPTVQPPPRRRGPAGTHDWHTICGEIARRCIDKRGRIVVPRTLKQDMLQWCADELDREPAASEMSEAIRRVCAQLQKI